MKFDISMIWKVLLAFVSTTTAAAAAAAPSGVDVTALPADQWAASALIGLGAVGTLLYRPKSANEKAVTSIQNVADQAIKSQQQLTQQAVDSVKAVQDAVGALPVLVPTIVDAVTSIANPQAWQRPLGDLAQQVLSRIES